MGCAEMGKGKEKNENLQDWLRNKGRTESLEELLTKLLDLSSVRGQRRLNRLLKLDSD